jgi:hypothetical protein
MAYPVKNTFIELIHYIIFVILPCVSPIVKVTIYHLDPTHESIKVIMKNQSLRVKRTVQS